MSQWPLACTVNLRIKKKAVKIMYQNEIRKILSIGICLLVMAPEVWAKPGGSSGRSSRSGSSSRSSGSSKARSNSSRASHSGKSYTYKSGSSQNTGRHFSNLSQRTKSESKNRRLTERSGRISKFLTDHQNQSSVLDGPINMLIPINPLSPYYWLGLALKNQNHSEIQKRNLVISDSIVDEIAEIDECLENASKHGIQPEFCNDASWNLRLTITEIKDEELAGSEDSAVYLSTRQEKDETQIDFSYDGITRTKATYPGTNKQFFGRSWTLRYVIQHLDNNTDLFINYLSPDKDASERPKSEKFDLKSVLQGRQDIRFSNGKVVIQASVEKVFPKNIVLNEALAQREDQDLSKLLACGRILTRMGVDQSICFNSLTLNMPSRLDSHIMMNGFNSKTQKIHHEAYLYHYYIRSEAVPRIKLSDYFAGMNHNLQNSWRFVDSVMILEGSTFKSDVYFCTIKMNRLQPLRNFTCQIPGENKSVEIKVVRPKINVYESQARKVLSDYEIPRISNTEEGKKQLAQLSNALQIEALELYAQAGLALDADAGTSVDPVAQILKMNQREQFTRLQKIVAKRIETERLVPLNQQEWNEILN